MEQKKMKKRTAPPRYDDAFKAGAVRLVTEQGRQPAAMAKVTGRRKSGELESKGAHYGTEENEKTNSTPAVRRCIQSRSREASDRTGPSACPHTQIDRQKKES